MYTFLLALFITSAASHDWRNFHNNNATNLHHHQPFPSTTTPPTFTKPNCTTAVLLNTRFDLRPTCTVYDEYAVETKEVDCHGCSLTTIALGRGPAKLCKKVVTKPATTETLVRCSPSP